MESSSEEQGRRSMPPPLPPSASIDYFRESPMSREWVIVASLPTVGAWYTAKAILDRHRIVNRMWVDPSDSKNTDLLVLRPEAESARAVLRGSVSALGGQIIGMEESAADAGLSTSEIRDDCSDASPVEPIETPSLSARQQAMYSLFLALLGIAAIGVLILLVWMLATYAA